VQSTMHEGIGIDLGSLEVCSQDLETYEKVGTGRTATVYRGILKEKEVAVKELRECWTDLTQAEQVNLRREIEIMKELQHPLLLNLLGVQTGSTKLRIITDFCKGGDLFNLLHTKDEIDLTLNVQVQLLHDIATAMAFLHGSTPTVMHRDLKSLNILLLQPVMSEGDPIKLKICDFGQSRKIGSRPGTVCVGTHHWMAPEILVGEIYDHHADVFSFAMVMFEVLCREVPFEDFSVQKVALTVASGGRPDMEAVPPDCPALLVHLMVRCWAHEPRSRPDFTKIIAVLDSLKNML